jgi:hypothetical protein
MRPVSPCQSFQAFAKDASGNTTGKFSKASEPSEPALRDGTGTVVH